MAASMDLEINAPASSDPLSKDNIPTNIVLEKYYLSSAITSSTMRFILAQCKSGANTADLCRLGDSIILSQVNKAGWKTCERGVAEPTSISVNNCVRWYAPTNSKESYILQGNDVVTVSLGTHIDGYSAISSQTIYIPSNIPQSEPMTGRIADAFCALHYATKAIVKLLSQVSLETSISEKVEEIVWEAAQTFNNVKIVEGSSLRRIRRFLVGQSTVTEANPKLVEFGLSSATSSGLMGDSDWNVEPGEVYLLDLAFSTHTGKVKLHPDLKPTLYTRSTTHNHPNPKLSTTRNLLRELTSQPYVTVFPFSINHLKTPRSALGVAELLTLGVIYPQPTIIEKDPSATVVRRSMTIFIRRDGEVEVFSGGEGETKVPWVKSEFQFDPNGTLARAVDWEGVKVKELKIKDFVAETEKMELD